MLLPDWLVPLTIVSMMLVFPFGLVFRRIGRPPALCLIGIIPFGIVLLPWMVAFMRWSAPPPVPRAKRISRRR